MSFSINSSKRFFFPHFKSPHKLSERTIVSSVLYVLKIFVYRILFPIKLWLDYEFIWFLGNSSATSWRGSTTAPTAALGLDSLAGSGSLASTTTESTIVADTSVVSATETASATTTMDASSTLSGDAVSAALSGKVTSSNTLPYPAASLNSEDTLASQLSGTTTSSSAATDFANLKSSSLFGSVMNHTASTAIGGGVQKPAAGTNGSTGTGETQEVRLQPVHGVAPLGPVHLSQERVKQLKMLDGAYHHLPQRQDSERMRSVWFFFAFLLLFNFFLLFFFGTLVRNNVGCWLL